MTIIIIIMIIFPNQHHDHDHGNAWGLVLFFRVLLLATTRLRALDLEMFFWVLGLGTWGSRACHDKLGKRRQVWKPCLLCMLVLLMLIMMMMMMMGLDEDNEERLQATSSVYGANDADNDNDAA